MIFGKKKFLLVSDGKNFAVKSPEGKYFDFKSEGFWWKSKSQFFKDCWTDDKALAEMWLNRFLS